MMNCIYETSTWTFSKETSHTHKHPKYTFNQPQLQPQGLIVWCVCMAIKNIKFNYITEKKVNTLIFC